MTRNAENSSYEDVQIEANISLARPIMKYSHLGVISNVFFRSEIHREGEKLPLRPKYHLTY